MRLEILGGQSHRGLLLIAFDVVRRHEHFRMSQVAIFVLKYFRCLPIKLLINLYIFLLTNSVAHDLFLQILLALFNLPCACLMGVRRVQSHLFSVDVQAQFLAGLLRFYQICVGPMHPFEIFTLNLRLRFDRRRSMRQRICRSRSFGHFVSYS